MNLKEKSSNILELLAIEDCENDTWVILNSVERIINAINTWNISDNDCKVLLEFINRSFFQRNIISKGVLILETYITCKKNCSNEELRDCINDFFRSVSNGLVVSMDDFEIITQFSQKYNLYDFEYSSYYNDAKALLHQRKNEYNFIAKFLPNMRICISESIKINSNDFSLFEYIVEYNSYEIKDYIKSNDYILIKRCFQEMPKTTKEYDNYLLYDFLTFLVNECRINSNIFEYYERNDEFKSIVKASPEKHTVFLAKILAHSLMYGTMNEFENTVEICQKLPIDANVKNKFNYVFSKVNYDTIINRANPQINEFINIYDKICYLQRTIPLLRIETTEFTSFFIEIIEIKHDIDLVKKYLDYYEQMIAGDLWTTPEKIPKKIMYSFKFPNGVRGDINKYLAEKYGTVSQLSALKYKAIIHDISLDHLSILLETQSGNNIPEQNLNLVERYFKPRITECPEFKHHITYHFSEWREMLNKRDTYWNGMQNTINAFYSFLVSEGVASPKWTSEFQLFTLVKKFYPNAKYQYHATWLGHQSLDIFIPSLSVGIEYQGIQHYKPVSIFGGEKGYQATKERDKRKKRICSENKVILFEWKYSDEITIDAVKSMINGIEHMVSNN